MQNLVLQAFNPQANIQQRKQHTESFKRAQICEGTNPLTYLGKDRYFRVRRHVAKEFSPFLIYGDDWVNMFMFKMNSVC